MLDGFGAFTAPPPTARPVPANFNARASADHPPGFYGPPEGLLAVNTLAPADRLAPLDYRRAQRPARSLSARRAARPARTGVPRGAGAAGARRAGGVLRCPAASAACCRAAARRRLLAAAGLLAALACMHPAHAQTGRRRSRRRNCPRSSEDFAMKATQRDPSRLCRHRRCRGRRHQQGRPARASRCSWRSAPRSRPANRSASIRRATNLPSSR